MTLRHNSSFICSCHGSSSPSIITNVWAACAQTNSHEMPWEQTGAQHFPTYHLALLKYTLNKLSCSQCIKSKLIYDLRIHAQPHLRLKGIKGFLWTGFLRVISVLLLVTTDGKITSVQAEMHCVHKTSVLPPTSKYSPLKWSHITIKKVYQMWLWFFFF